MISKYFPRTAVITVSILLFSSCLKSSYDNLEYPVDPQIYSISLSSSADTAELLNGVVFTIDQVKEEIFNKQPLPYLFYVDSVILNISGSSSYYSFTRIDITLDEDSTYSWNGSDSIAIPRLTNIKTTAPDGISTKTYSFRLNIYQSDPDSIIWGRVAVNHPAAAVGDQKTVAFNNRFFTYYLSNNEIKAVSAPISGTPEWEEKTLTGMPHTLRLSSLYVTDTSILGIDNASGAAYRSADGIDWEPVQTEAGFEVIAFYGALPFASPGTILLAVRHQGALKFARTENFTEISPMDNLPDNVPVTGFSAITVESGTSYASKYIVVSGGTTAGNNPNNDILLLQEDDGEITLIRSTNPAEGILKGSSLFFYDDKTWLLASTTDGKNLLIYSADYGLHWAKTGDNQAFPTAPVAFTGRTNASVIIDDNYIWIFGGISASNTQLTDIWKGRLNRFDLI